jgi:hypothetical protein
VISSLQVFRLKYCVYSFHTYYMKLVITCTLHQILLRKSYQGRMGGACSTHGRDEKCIIYFGRKTRSKENTRKTLTQMGV